MRRAICTLLTVAGMLAAGCGHMPLNAHGRLPGGASALSDDLDASHPYNLYTLPDQGTQPLLQAIANAQESIQLEIYMITNSGAAADMVNALIAKAQAGVDVRVILEVQPFMPPAPPNCGAPQSLDVNKKAREALLAGGVKVVYSSPQFKYTHEKAMVVDHKAAYIMTTNFTGAAFKNNREYVVVTHTPDEVQALAAVFDADWNARPLNPALAAPLVLSPVNSRSKLRDLIDGAKRSIAIEVEFATDPELLAHLGAKAKAGVDVAVLVSSQGVDKCTGSDIDEDEIKAFNAAGVTKVAVMKKLVLHAKAIVVDGNTAYVGSENLSANSLDNNREVGIIVHDQRVVNKLASTLRVDWLGSTSMTADMPVPDVEPDAP